VRVRRERIKEINKNTAGVGAVSNAPEDKTNRVFPKKLRGFGGLFTVIVVFTQLLSVLLFCYYLNEKTKTIRLETNKHSGRACGGMQNACSYIFAGKVRKCGKRRWRREAKKERRMEREREGERVGARGVDRFMQSLMNLGRRK